MAREKRLTIVIAQTVNTDKRTGSGSSQKESIEIEGIVQETLPSATFRVKTEKGIEILGHLAGKLRVNNIRILPGDKVILELSPYDLTRGRIIKRLR